MSETTERIEYVCGNCGKSVWVRPYTDDEVDLIGDWGEDGDDAYCGECERQRRAGYDE